MHQYFDSPEKCRLQRLVLTDVKSRITQRFNHFDAFIEKAQRRGVPRLVIAYDADYEREVRKYRNSEGAPTPGGWPMWGLW